MNTCRIQINKLKKCAYGTEDTDWKGQEDKLDFAKICSIVDLIFLHTYYMQLIE